MLRPAQSVRKPPGLGDESSQPLSFIKQVISCNRAFRGVKASCGPDDLLDTGETARSIMSASRADRELMTSDLFNLLDIPLRLKLVAESLSEPLDSPWKSHKSATIFPLSFDDSHSHLDAQYIEKVGTPF